MQDKDYEIFLRDLQFGIFQVKTRGVPKDLYDQLHPHINDEISKEEVYTRMLRTQMLWEKNGDNETYRGSRGLFVDFTNACNAIKNSIYLESNENNVARDKGFGFLDIKTKKLPKTIKYGLEGGRKYRIKPEYNKHASDQGISFDGPNIYFYWPEYLYGKDHEGQTQVSEDLAEKNKRSVDEVADLFVNEGWQAESHSSIITRGNELKSDISDYKISSSQGVFFLSRYGLATRNPLLITNPSEYTGSLESLEKMINILCRFFDKNENILRQRMKRLHNSSEKR